FRADILSFYWIFQGTGRYSLHPNGTTGILLDTIDSNGTARIELLTIAERVTIQVTFQVDSLYGSQPLGILRVNSSELQVAPNGTGWTLRYVDQANNVTRDLGPISSSWQQATVRTSPGGQEIEALGNRFVLPRQDRIGPVWVGHTHLVGGGQFSERCNGTSAPRDRGFGPFAPRRAASAHRNLGRRIVPGPEIRA